MREPRPGSRTNNHRESPPVSKCTKPFTAIFNGRMLIQPWKQLFWLPQPCPFPSPCSSYLLPDPSLAPHNYFKIIAMWLAAFYFIFSNQRTQDTESQLPFHCSWFFGCVAFHLCGQCETSFSFTTLENLADTFRFYILQYHIRILFSKCDIHYTSRLVLVSCVLVTKKRRGLSNVCQHEKSTTCIHGCKGSSKKDTPHEKLNGESRVLVNLITM